MSIRLGTIVAIATAGGVKMGVVFEKKETLIAGESVAQLGVRYESTESTDGHDESTVAEDDVNECDYAHSVKEFLNKHGGGEWASKEADRLKTRIPEPVARKVEDRPLAQEPL